MDSHADYVIVVHGELDPGWAGWFNVSQWDIVQDMDGTQMRFIFHDLDQAALHGVLKKIRDLNLTLRSVTRQTCDKRS